ncbi:MAG: domain protein beta Propeller [Myxococcales bacterium]|nr:domain protein beta Propeller [Myxococcales bacterium]
MAAERGPNGIRLVSIDERGDRLFEVVQPAPGLARDTNPAISPDCAWIVFASSRDRPLAETSLWIAKLEPEAMPIRITQGPAIDSHPTWTHDGRAIIFASASGASAASSARAASFDLYRLPIDRGKPTGEAERLTRGNGHEVTPVTARDGTLIYAEVTPQPEGQVESHLEQLAPDGTISKLTAGPADSSPALSPDDQTIAFARPKQHPGSVDAELWTMPRSGDPATQLIDVPLTDESGPVWSRDGRFVFATSALRGASGNVVFSSVVHVDLTEHPRVARMLEDRTGAIARLTPAIGCTHLDATALHGDPEYLPEVARIVARAIAEQKQTAEPIPP